jgi:hypothetical protein
MVELDGALPGEFDWRFAAPVAAFNRAGSKELKRLARVHGPADSDKFNVVLQTNPALPIPREFKASWAHFRDNEDRICAKILDAIVKHYPLARRRLIDQAIIEPNDTTPDFAPPVRTLEDLLPLFALRELFVHADEDNLVTLGFEFECTWEPEHGLGVRVRGERVIGIAGADMAFGDRDEVEYWLEHFGDGIDTLK